MRAHRITAFTLAFCLAAPAVALQAQRDAMSFRVFNLEDGLSQHVINTVVQDRTGFMWFGSQDGLNRYDGYNFRIFSHDAEQSGGLQGNDVHALYIDSQQRLWVGTSNGLSVYDDSAETFTLVDSAMGVSAPGGGTTRAIVEDYRGRIWFSIDGHGIARVDPGDDQLHSYRHQPDVPGTINSNSAYSIFEDSHRRLWVGTDRGLNLYHSDEDRFSIYPLGDLDPDSIANVTVRAIYEDRDGNLWVGADGYGVYMAAKGSDRFVLVSAQVGEQYNAGHLVVTDILQTSDQVIWVGFDGSGLYYYDDSLGRLRRHRAQDDGASVPLSTRVTALYEDNSGGLWVGSFDKGIYLHHPYRRKFVPQRIYDHTAEDTEVNYVRAFLEDRRGRLWVGSEGGGIGIVDSNGNRPTLYRHDPSDTTSLSSDRVYSIIEDEVGDIWVGTANGGVHRYDEVSESFVRYQCQSSSTDSDSIFHDDVRVLLKDSQGIFWLGINGGGLHQFDYQAGTCKHYHHDPSNPNSINNNNVRTILEDQAGRIWIGMWGGGLNLYNRATDDFKSYQNDPDNANTLAYNVVMSLHSDQDGVLWIGTAGGLDRYDPSIEQFTHYKEETGLPNLMIYGMVADDQGYLWLSHNKGISRFDPRTLTTRNYDSRDGLQNNEFNGGAYYKGRSGAIYFGGVAGYNAFEPSQIQDNPHLPHVIITDLRLFNHSVPIGRSEDGRSMLQKSIVHTDHITLSHEDLVVSFEFSALNYAQADKNEFAYMMEGFETDWNYALDRRFATYTTLPPGQYTFKVKASNNDGLWNEQGAAVELTVTPPFWMTWWFRLSVALVLGLATMLVFKLRMRSIKTTNKRLNDLVAERTEELEQRKTYLEETLEELHETKDALIDAAHRAGVAETTAEVLHNVGNLLNSVTTSSALIRDTLADSATTKLSRMNSRLREKLDSPDFLSDPAKVKTLLEYYVKLETAFSSEHTAISDNSRRLDELIDSINHIIGSMQQFSDDTAEQKAQVNLSELIEEALLLQSASIEADSIEIERDYQFDETVCVNRPRLLQVIIGIYKNAHGAMLNCDRDRRVLNIRTFRDGDYACIAIADNGRGIPEDQLEQIFVQTSTVQEGGPGMALHMCANSMSAMRGKIRAQSDGPGSGSTFVLSLPLAA